MAELLEYPKITDARAAISEIYSTAERHLVVRINREGDAPVAVIRNDNLKEALQALCPLDPQVRFSKNGTVSMWIDGLPVSSQGSSLPEAENELIGALRDYAQTWVEELKNYPNHKDRWGIANLVMLSSDSELSEFLFGND